MGHADGRPSSELGISMRIAYRYKLTQQRLQATTVCGKQPSALGFPRAAIGKAVVDGCAGLKALPPSPAATHQRLLSLTRLLGYEE